MTDPSTPRYHHGDARNALLAAAAELIEQTGVAGLSLRQVAERAGVSRQAPYNHFADKAALLADLNADGFASLRAALAEAADGPGGPADRLRDASLAYIAFAQSRPALFRLMFAGELVDPTQHPQVQAGQTSALAVVEGIVAGMARPEDVADLTLAAWALVHGYATLCNEAGLEAPNRRDDRAAQFARMIEAAADSRRITKA